MPTRYARSSVGDGYHLRPNTGGVVVFGCGVGFAFACGSGLGHRLKDADESGSRCTHDGCLKKKVEKLCDHPL